MSNLTGRIDDTTFTSRLRLAGKRLYRAKGLADFLDYWTYGITDAYSLRESTLKDNAPQRCVMCGVANPKHERKGLYCQECDALIEQAMNDEVWSEGQGKLFSPKGGDKY